MDVLSGRGQDARTISTLSLGSVKLPDAHPRAAEGDALIQGFVIHHPDGPIVVDTGVADDHDRLNELYQPTAVPLIDALNSVGVDEREVAGIINTHLHFDHCGQNRTLPSVPVYVQAAELAAALLPRFTIPEWAEITPERQRVIDGDAEIAAGVTVVATPGHTPGHQSIVVRSGDRVEVIVGQCCYTCSEFSSGTLLPADMHDESMLDQGRASLERLRRLDPAAGYFSHDTTIFRG